MALNPSAIMPISKKRSNTSYNTVGNKNGGELNFLGDKILGLNKA